MEYSLTKNNNNEGNEEFVLILILMEYSLTEIIMDGIKPRVS